jgi:hypothetical protein
MARLLLKAGFGPRYVIVHGPGGVSEIDSVESMLLIGSDTYDIVLVEGQSLYAIGDTMIDNVAPIAERTRPPELVN